jgi:integrase
MQIIRINQWFSLIYYQFHAIILLKRNAKGENMMNKTFAPVPIKKFSRQNQFSSKSLAVTFNKPLPKYFTAEEVQQILSEDLKESNYKQYFLCLFLWNTGVRVSEALSVKVEDVDLRGMAMKIWTLKRKNNNERVVPLQSQFIGEVAVWISEKGLKRGDVFFPFNRKTAYNYVREACKLAGIEDERCHPHTFRHSFAVNCILHSVPVTVLRKWLGHRDITKTLIYTQILALDSRIFMDQVRF